MRTIIVLLVAMTLLSGCAAADPKPFLTLGVVHQIDRFTSPRARTERSWQCSNPQGIMEIGVETKNRWRVAWQHQSWISCGFPFNNKPEMYQDSIRVTKTWGGQ